MGFIRGVLLVLVSIIFLLSILSFGILFTISSSLKYEIVQNQAVNMPLTEQLNLTQWVNLNSYTINSYCQSNSDFVFSNQGYTFRFSCQDINSSSLIVNDTIKNFVSDMYYQQYDCNYWDCFSKYTPPFFLISQKSQSYWNDLLYYSITAVILSAILLFFLFKRKYNLLFMSGIVIIVSSFLILGIEKLLAIFSNQIIFNITILFFSQSGFVFVRMFIGGIILIFTGLIVELFRAGFKIYNMFSRIGETEPSNKIKIPSKKKK